MNTIVTATETHRLGDRVHIKFTDESNPKSPVALLGGGRYYDAADWDDDDKAEEIVAVFAQELVDRAAPVQPSAPIKTLPLVRTASQIMAVLDRMEEARLAEVAATAKAATDAANAAVITDSTSSVAAEVDIINHQP